MRIKIFFSLMLSLISMGAYAQLYGLNGADSRVDSRNYSSGKWGADVERYDSATGKIYFETVDAVLPNGAGVDIKLIRTFNKVGLPGRNAPLEIGLWNYEVPEIVGRMPQSDNFNSTYCEDPTNLGISDGAKIPFTGLKLRIPGDPERQLFFKVINGKVVKSQMVTRDFWKTSCAPGLGFYVTSPAGVTYHMSYPSRSKTINTMNWKTISISNNYPSGSVEYSYVATPYGHSVVKKIEDSGTSIANRRVINFNYIKQPWLSTSSMLLDNVNINGHAIKFEYNTPNFPGLLSAVTKANGDVWSYQYTQNENGGNLVRISGIRFPNGGQTQYAYWWGASGGVENRSRLKQKEAWAFDEFQVFSQDVRTWDYTYDQSLPDPLNNGQKLKYTVITSDTTVTLMNRSKDKSSLGTTTYKDEWQNTLIWPKADYKKLAGSAHKLETKNLVWTKIFYANSLMNASSGSVTNTDVNDYKLGSRRTILFTNTGNGAIDREYVTEFSEHDEFSNPQKITDYWTYTRYLPIQRIDRTYYGTKRIKNYTYDNSNDVLGKVLTVEYVGLEGTNKIVNTYTSYGQLATSSKFGKTTSYQYDAVDQGNLSKITDPNLNTIMFRDYYLGIAKTVIQTVDGKTLIKTKVVNTDGTIASETDEKVNTTSYSYTNGEVSTIDFPLGDDLNITRSPQYRGTKNLTFSSATSPGWLTTNDLGNTVAEGLSSESVVKSLYDEFGRLTFKSYPGSFVPGQTFGQFLTYDHIGRVKETSDSWKILPQTRNGETLKKSYSYAGGDIVRITNELQKTTHIEFEKFGNHGDLSRPTKITTPEGVIQTISYNILGNVKTVTNGVNVITYTYDDSHRLWKEDHPGLATIVYTRDDNGNVLTKKIGANPAMGFVYNERNQLIQKGVILGKKSLTTDYFYDRVGNLMQIKNPLATISYSYNANNSLTQETLSFKNKNFKISYDYDASKYLSSITYPSGETIDYAPRYDGKATQVGRFVTDAQWYLDGKLKWLINANGTRTDIGITGRNQIKTVANDFVSTEYGYDDVGNVDLITNSNYEQRIISYDNDNRLLNSSFIDTQGQRSQRQEFTYDRLGNIESIRNSGTGTSIAFSDLSLVYDTAVNRLTSVTGRVGKRYSNIQYDYQGNIKNDGEFGYTFDAFSRLIQVNSPSQVSYKYDGNDHLIYKNPGSSNEVFYFYSLAGKKLLEYMPGDSALSDDTLKEFYYLENNLVATKKLTNMDLDDTDGDTMSDAYELFNGLDMNKAPYNTVRRKGGEGVLVYDDKDKDGLSDLDEFKYGSSPNSLDTDGDGLSDGDNTGFTGYPEDGDTGLSYARARWYNPELGRFISRDPVGINPGDVNSFNRYAYANNNPYRFVDRDGRTPSPIELAFWAVDGIKLVGAYYSGNSALTRSATLDFIDSSIGLVGPPGTGWVLKSRRLTQLTKPKKLTASVGFPTTLNRGVYDGKPLPSVSTDALKRSTSGKFAQTVAIATQGVVPSASIGFMISLSGDLPDQGALGPATYIGPMSAIPEPTLTVLDPGYIDSILGSSE